MVPAREDAVVTAGLMATGGGGVEDIEVALSLSGAEAMKLFERGGEAGRSFNSADLWPKDQAVSSFMIEAAALIREA